VVDVLRSDARRNRARLIASARKLFATRGVDVPVEDITQDAGVGMGTLYRHFPTKEELIDAVLEDAFDDYVALADAALEQEDARAGLESFLEGALAASAANRGLAEVAGQRVTAMRRRLKPKLRELAARTGLDADDLEVVLHGGAGVIERSPSPEARSRYLRVVLEGLRP
jgi:AcrR family transcriptional regulator